MKFIHRFSQNKILIISAVIILLVVVSNEIKTGSKIFCASGSSTQNNFKLESVAPVPSGYEGVFRNTDADRKYLANLDGHTNLNIGAEYQIESTIKSFKDVEGSDFSYATYMRKRGICGEILIREGKTIQNNSTGNLKNYVFKLRENIFRRVESTFAKQSASLFLAIVFGDTYLFDEKIEEDFRKIGITHLVAVSGANFILIVSIFKTFLRPFRSPLRLIFISIIATVYMLFVGLDNMAAFRAFIFFLLHNIQYYVGFRLSRVNHFMLSIAVIQTLNSWAYSDIGFQLSVTAWLIVNLFLGGLLQKVNWMPEYFRAEVLSAAFGTFLILPVSLWYFDEVNLLSIAFNLLFVPIFGLLSIVFVGLLPIVALPVDVSSQIAHLVDSSTLWLTSSIQYAANYQWQIVSDSRGGLLLFAGALVFYLNKLFYIWKYEADNNQITKFIG